MLEPVDLVQDLPVAVGALPGKEVFPALLQLHIDPALVDDALVLFLEFQKDRALRVLGDAVAAQPQLFFVDRLFQRGANQLEIVGIKIDAADGVQPVLVQLHPLLDSLPHHAVLLGGEQILLLVSFERFLYHMNTSFGRWFLLTTKE